MAQSEFAPKSCWRQILCVQLQCYTTLTQPQITPSKLLLISSSQLILVLTALDSKSNNNGRCQTVTVRQPMLEQGYAQNIMEIQQKEDMQ